MSKLSEDVFDAYIVRMHVCKRFWEFDEVMLDASNDSRVSHHDFVRLCCIAKSFMWNLDHLEGEFYGP